MAEKASIDPNEWDSEDPFAEETETLGDEERTDLSAEIAEMPEDEPFPPAPAATSETSPMQPYLPDTSAVDPDFRR